MDEIAERREEMDSILKVLKFAEEGKLAEADKSVINQYHSVFTVYKPVSNTYKNAVLEAEDHFYRLKRLEKSVKAGEFDKKQEEFKKTYADLQREVLENAARAKEVSNRLKAVEPMYLRLEPKIEEILERTAP